MSSKKIILDCFKNNFFDNNENNIATNKKKKYNLNKNSELSLKNYFKNNYDNIKKEDFFDIIIENYLYKIEHINNFKKNINYSSKFKFVYSKLMSQFIIDKIFKYEPEKVKERYESFFNLQTKVNNKQIFSLINYQYIFSKYYEKYIFNLVRIETHYIHSEIHDFSNIYEEDKDITCFLKNYFSKFDIKKLPSSKENKIKNLTEEEKNIFNILKNIVQNIIKKTLNLFQDEKFKNSEKNILVYGSYTSYLLNYNVNYNDIDLYHTDSLNFLTIIMMLFYFILDVEVDIFKIPFLLGHLSLRYKNNHFVDCIYLDKYTLNNIPFSVIKKVNVLDPLVQMFNNFRMMSEIFRLDNINKNKEETILKYSVLLKKTNEKLNFDFKNLLNIKHNLKFEIIDNSFILINLSAGFQDFEEYKDLKKIKKFDYLIISFTEPKILFKMIENRNDLRISKQYFALFNEISIEFENKKKNNIFKKKTQEHNKQQINIQETDIEVISKKTSIKLPDELLNIIDYNNVLLMSNISTNLYLKKHITKEKICENIELSNISKETILSSFMLYSILKKSDENLIKFYVKYFLSFLKTNKKTDEFKLLENKTKYEEKSNYDKLIKYSKIKICGKHQVFSVYNLYFKNVFFFNVQNKDYYDYDEFIKLTNYNENLKIK